MIMGREKSLGSDDLGVAYVFDDRPGKTKSIESTGAAPDLIQDQQAVAGGMAEDVGNFAHFDHKGRLSAGQVVRSADAGKNTVRNRDARAVCRNEAADLSHQDDGGHLPHVGRFSAHVWSGDDRDAVILHIHIGIVGDESIIRQHPFYYGMTAFFDDQFAAGRQDLRPYVLITVSGIPQGPKAVQLGYQVRSALYTPHGSQHRLADLLEQIVFQLLQPVLGSQKGVLYIFQFFSNISFAVDQGLLADITVRYQAGLSLADLQIIAEHTIVTDLQIFDAGRFLFLCFQLCQPGSAVCGGTPEPVDFRVITGLDQSAFPKGYGRFVTDGFIQKSGNIVQRVQFFLDL